MSRTRVADDFTTIRARMEELRRKRVAEQQTTSTATKVAVNRGPCACGMALFADECDGSCKLL
jgi:hypothetical protein